MTWGHPLRIREKSALFTGLWGTDSGIDSNFSAEAVPNLLRCLPAAMRHFPFGLWRAPNRSTGPFGIQHFQLERVGNGLLTKASIKLDMMLWLEYFRRSRNRWNDA